MMQTRRQSNQSSQADEPSETLRQRRPPPALPPRTPRPSSLTELAAAPVRRSAAPNASALDNGESDLVMVQPLDGAPQDDASGQSESPAGITTATTATQTTTSATYWMLHIRTSPSLVNDDDDSNNILQLCITPNMNAALLASCLEQMLMSAPSVAAATSTPICGLFVDSTFYSLQHVLDLRNETALYTTSPRRQRNTTPEPHHRYRGWDRPLRIALLAAAVPGAIFALYWHTRTILDGAFYAGITLYDYLVQAPLLDWYRHGPWILGGWEGEALPTICTRITYHGDVAFWSRHWAECEHVYGRKEQAFVRTTRPLLLLFMLLLTVLVWKIVRHALWQHFRRRHRPWPPPDPDMVQTYQAFTTIIGQVQRQWQHEQRRAERKALPPAAAAAAHQRRW